MGTGIAVMMQRLLRYLRWRRPPARAVCFLMFMTWIAFLTLFPSTAFPWCTIDLYLHKVFFQTYFDGLQASAPEGACHDNVKSLGKILFNCQTFIYKYLDIQRESIYRPKNPTNENFIKILFICQIQHFLSKLHLSMTHAVSGFIPQI